MANDKCLHTLQFGDSTEKLGIMRELEEIAKECRTKAEPLLDICVTPAEREKNAPWREFRRQIGFPLFNVVLDIAQGPSGLELRDLAADILAHLWHPAAVGRLEQDLRENSKNLTHTQISGIFSNLAGIGNEPAAQALMRLWEEGYEFECASALGACNARSGNAFLLRQAVENSNADLRGYCLLFLKLSACPETEAFLRDRLRHGANLELSVAIRQAGLLRLASLEPDLVRIQDQTENSDLKKEIAQALKCMRR